MELYEYIKIFKTYRQLIFGITIAGVVIALGVSSYRAQQYEASFSLIIRPKVIEKTENFQLTDIFEASDRVTRMTENWLKEQKLDIKTKRLGSQIIKISFQKDSEENARAVMDDIEKKSNIFLSSLSPAQGLGSFEALNKDFVFAKQNPYWVLSISVGLLFGLFIGLFAGLFQYYLAP